MGGEIKTYTAHMRYVKRLVKSSKREKPKFIPAKKEDKPKTPK